MQRGGVEWGGTVDTFYVSAGTEETAFAGEHGEDGGWMVIEFADGVDGFFD